MRVVMKKKNQNKNRGAKPMLALRMGLKFLINKLSRSKSSDSEEHSDRI